MNTTVTQQAPTYLPHQIPPAQLWIGNAELCTTQVITFLQRYFCSNQGCNVCTACRQINDQQHHSVHWLAPTNYYTLQDLAIIPSTISYALATGHHHFFIITQADFLTAQCANSLLKSLEEPPTGYHFILLVQREESLLPTIRSRCVIHHVHGSTQTVQHEKIWHIFTQKTAPNPTTFLKELDQAKMNEQESIDFIDQLLIYWINRTKNALLNQEMNDYDNAQRMVELFKQASLLSPMPGSSNLFWKNLFLKMNACKN